MRLKMQERETLFLFNAAEDTATIYTSDPIWQRKLKKLEEKNPDCFTCLYEDAYGIKYQIPKKLICLRSKEKTATFTEEQKKNAAGRLPRRG